MDKKVNLKNHELKKLGDFLQNYAGITLEKNKLQRFKRKIEDIFIEKNIENFSSFYHELRFKSNSELIEALTNALTVNETYFWREYEQFDFLVEKILPRFILPNKQNKVRILVSPCSSGEEIYSIMLRLIDEKRTLELLNIEMIGIDIDSNMIDKAKRAVYTKRSIEKLPKHLLESYFKKKENFYNLESSISKNATFLHANIFDKNISKRLGDFDILFSRNMLIYFNDKDKQKAFEQFFKLLKKRGYLFLGHADANKIDKTLFQTYGSGFNLYQKKE